MYLKIESGVMWLVGFILRICPQDSGIVFMYFFFLRFPFKDSAIWIFSYEIEVYFLVK